jgi:hypothetical protein
LVILPAIALAQTAPRELPRVVLINDGVEATSRPFVDRFLKGMREHGQLDGKTFRLQVLYANRRHPDPHPGKESAVCFPLPERA